MGDATLNTWILPLQTRSITGVMSGATTLHLQIPPKSCCKEIRKLNAEKRGRQLAGMH